MLFATFKIKFENLSENNKIEYSGELTKYMIFKFTDELYYTGYISEKPDISSYEFGVDYTITFEFPFFNKEDYYDTKEILDNRKILDIVIGKKVIGRGKILASKFLED